MWELPKVKTKLISRVEASTVQRFVEFDLSRFQLRSFGTTAQSFSNHLAGAKHVVRESIPTVVPIQSLYLSP